MRAGAERHNGDIGVLTTMPRQSVHQDIQIMPNKNVRQFNPRHTRSRYDFPHSLTELNQKKSKHFN